MHTDSYMANRNGFGRIGLILVLLTIVSLIGAAVYLFFFAPEPVVTGTDGFKLLSSDTSVTFRGENLSSLELSIFQEGNITELMKDTPAVKDKTYTLQIKPRDLKLSDGTAIIIVKAKAGIFKKVRYEIETVIDTTPPALEVMSFPSVLNRGSSGIAVLGVKDADSVYIKLGNRRFPAFEAGTAEFMEPSETSGYGEEPLMNGYRKRSTPKKYHVLFPAPFDSSTDDVFYVIATDAAGNRTVKSLGTKIRSKRFKTSKINIDDKFINTVIAPLLNVTSISEPVMAFKKVNEEWRGESHRKILDIAQKTSGDILWSGRFLQLRNSKVMATYGDKRTYLYNGEEISGSVHMGYDLASFSNAPVGAANTGVVVYAGDLNIYGRTVIIDHGLGLMSIYGHLSAIFVEEGQSVDKGQKIGKSGSTGLAGGDHLHFEVTVHGYAVSPLYWWDQNWIRINILDYVS